MIGRVALRSAAPGQLRLSSRPLPPAPASRVLGFVSRSTHTRRLLPFSSSSAPAFGSTTKTSVLSFRQHTLHPSFSSPLLVVPVFQSSILSLERPFSSQREYFSTRKFWFIEAKKAAIDLGWRFWYGTRDLYKNTLAANAINKKKKRGEHTTRAEERFLRQNRNDLRALVPFFLVWRIPIFGDFLLPIFVAKFSNLLPSTFRLQGHPWFRGVVGGIQERIANFKKRRKEFLEGEDVASVRATLEGRVEEILSKEGSIDSETVISLGPQLEKTFSIDKLNYNQLASLCSAVHIGSNGFGMAWVLRRRLRNHFEFLQSDDKKIVEEGGCSSLSLDEIQDATLERGLKVLGLSEAQLQNQLSEWIKISSSHPTCLFPLLAVTHILEYDLFLQPQAELPRPEELTTS